MSDDEEWRTIPSWPNYEASSLGRIRSLERYIMNRGAWRWRAGHVMRPRVDRQGRLFVRLTRDGREKACWVHLLVAEAFHGPRPEGLLTRHLDDDRQNNRPGNLVYGTKLDNWADGVRNGRRGLRVKQGRCSREHELQPPNRTKHHPCTACNRAYTALASGHGYARFSSDIQVIADWYYAEIMNPDPTRSRRKVNPT